MWSSNVLGALAAGFTVLAALFGLLAWGKAYSEGKAKDAALKQFQEMSLVHAHSGRHLTNESLDILRKGEKGTVTIRYLDNNPEVWSLAQEFETDLHATGWIVARPEPITVDRVPGMGVRLEVGVNLCDVQMDGEPLRLKEPAKTMWEFFKANFQTGGTGGFLCNKHDLAPDDVVIVIGSKTYP
jgi:hypothetical protein